MGQQSWERQYLAALLTSKIKTAEEFESAEFVSKTVGEPKNGVQELLLHRAIAKLNNTTDALKLLDFVRKADWDSYAPRILARIADTEVVIKDRPALSGYFQMLRGTTGYTAHSIKDWQLVQ